MSSRLMRHWLSLGWVHWTWWFCQHSMHPPGQMLLPWNSSHQYQQSRRLLGHHPGQVGVISTLASWQLQWRAAEALKIAQSGSPDWSSIRLALHTATNSLQAGSYCWSTCWWVSESVDCSSVWCQIAVGESPAAAMEVALPTTSALSSHNLVIDLGEAVAAGPSILTGRKTYANKWDSGIT